VEIMMPLRKFFMLGTLAGAAAGLFVAARRQKERAGAIRDMVGRRDWESASPLKPVGSGDKLPTPEKAAEKVTGVAPAEQISATQP